MGVDLVRVDLEVLNRVIIDRVCLTGEPLDTSAMENLL